ncbi:MAG: hypothetical protein WC551_13345 [Patescibacteria group bacterium]
MSRNRHKNSARVHLDIGTENAAALTEITEQLGTDVTKFVRLLVTTYLASYRTHGADLLWPPRFLTISDAIHLKSLKTKRK